MRVVFLAALGLLSGVARAGWECKEGYRLCGGSRFCIPAKRSCSYYPDGCPPPYVNCIPGAKSMGIRSGRMSYSCPEGFTGVRRNYWDPGYCVPEVTTADREAGSDLQAGKAKDACASAQASFRRDPRNGRAFAIAQMSCGGQSKKVKVNIDALGFDKKVDNSNLKPNQRRMGDFAKGGIGSQAGAPPAADPRLGEVPEFKAPPPDEEVMAAGRAQERREVTRIAQLKALRHWEEVISEANALLVEYPQNLELLNVKAFAENMLRLFKEALGTADTAIDIEKTNVPAHINKAYALKGLGDRDGMLAALTTAAALDPQFEELLRRALKASDAAGLDFGAPWEETKAAPQPRRGGWVSKGAAWLGTIEPGKAFLFSLVFMALILAVAGRIIWKRWR